MSKEIIGLDPSAQYHNKGLGDYIEAEAAWDIAISCKWYLEHYHGPDCEVVLSRESMFSLRGRSDYLSQEIRALNNAACDIAISIHTDAGGGRGVTCFKGGVESERIGQALLDAFDDAGLLPLRQDKPIYHYNGPTYLGVIRRTKMPTCLIECGFHDHPKDIKVIGNREGRQAVGVILAQGIVEYYGWDTLAPENSLRVVLLPGSHVIECNPVIEDGVARCDLRPLVEALGREVIPNHIKEQGKIYIR